ncbi:glycosyltransferase family 31 protein [Stemphylium lycopersici]|uniref:N-acetylgalactosaminide beta-1,3-galactosyltransferase n=1 Tax=Stemphylium lycopersici TaxID=183478 RepID=A0A364MXC3_STELY|nr:glycosyltransferase family 31 protein [Stemphylium lycopersici]RAQ99171.1 glycosyltransferase family 31 protein [Stemphylium lycopersici]RAR06265.1 glycosyltransferase family 31 protein [Stemphylium lycopersici]
MPQRNLICRLLFCALVSVSLLNIFTRASTPLFHHPGKASAHHHSNDVFCPQSKLADDILVVLRTGATESLEKVPVHFRTTLRCVPHFVVHSDLDEEIEGHTVHDVLKGVSENTKQDSDDFKLYHQLQEHGRPGVKQQQVMTSLSGSSQGDYLRTDNAGWQLDKWKFLPMIDQAIEKKPDAKWYVFIEADTYLGWNNLLEFLGNFDDKKPYYIGKHLFINDVEFAYGGAGFALSNPAIIKVSEQRSKHLAEYEEFTKTHWVGDCGLGKVFEDAKIPLHRAFPHLQGDSPATLNPATSKIDRDLWCYPTITYHHVSPAEIEELWDFEQDWYKRHQILLRHRDVFMELVRPKIDASVPAWDNMSADKEYNAHDHSAVENDLERNAWKSFEHCRTLCEEQDNCIQFSFDAGSCGISTSFKLGYAKPHGRIRSGWMLDRVDDLFRHLEDRCGMRDWFAPQESTANSELKMKRKRRI